MSFSILVRQVLIGLIVDRRSALGQSSGPDLEQIQLADLSAALFAAALTAHA